ncbi:hypothetical protein T440DRAFT_521112 [Plenodomus tracheiphilus IPT5]|uniref:Uncharacterized protein n=1 Tax=Plenodomus tracheiphilus IPT5 TaxID=1408161 RepID=A0A6A7AV21_9PLEO|nr:hypothetical protein T440DRAFT_521112 [Plenodomus tracheiphilus IPT5]
MATELKTYTKEELLAILGEKCPDALSKFPTPEAFSIKTIKRDRINSPALWVGHSVTATARKIKEVLWLEEYDIEKGYQHPGRDIHGVQIGNHGPLARYDPIFAPIYGADRRDDQKLQALFIGMHYSTEKLGTVNHQIKNAKGFKGNDVFGKLSPHGIVSCPFSNPMKALFRFVLLHCGYTTVFGEFKDMNGKAQGVKSLVYGLKKIAARMSDVQEIETEERTESEEQDDALFVQKTGGGGRKRAQEDETSHVETNKKSRSHH